MSIVIREANKSDSSLILKFVKELAKYEKAEHEVLATVSTIESSIFGENSSTKALICESNDQPIGFAVYFFNYSTWQGKNGLYLEDLYVSHSERGSGAGKILLKYFSKACGRKRLWKV